MICLDDLRSANEQRDLEWNTGTERVSITFRACELAGEVGELCNEIKKAERNRLGIAGGKVDRDAIADEMGDVLITLDLLAMDLGIDLSKAVQDKFNKTSIKHGLSARMNPSLTFSGALVSVNDPLPLKPTFLQRLILKLSSH